MTTDSTPPRRALATFLRGPGSSTPAPAPELPLPTPAPADIAPVDSAQTAADDAPAMDADASESPDFDPTGHAAAQVPGAPVPDDFMAVHSNAPGSDLAADDAATARIDGSSQPATAPAAAPSFLHRSRRASATLRWQWAMICALGLLLLLQVAMADRANLAADAATRPLISSLCAVLRCSVPAWHEPAAFTMLSRDIRPVPQQPGVLQVQASFRNDARWAQAWPALQLSLSDADGRVIGRRTLTATDYLGDRDDARQRLEPQQSAQVSFRIREPAAATVAFSFEFQ
ncbi:MAG: DUF3426 domain-containing protein [Stenotrophomonas sp.]